MKNHYLLILVTAIIILIPFTGNAQISLNVKAGITNVRYHNDVKGNVNKLNGYNIGLTSDIVIYKSLFIEPGLYYTYKEQTYPGYVHNQKSQFNYLESPLFLKYRKKITDNFFVDGKLGFFIEYGLSGEMNLKVNELHYSPEEVENVSEKAWSTNAIWYHGYDDRFNYGPSLGVAVEWNRFILDLSYLIGQNDVGTNHSELHSVNEGKDTVHSFKLNLGIRLF